MKRAFAALLIMSLFVYGLSFPIVASAKPPAISTSAQAAALIDVASGRILYSYNGDTPLKIASLTKIMTAIVAIEDGDVTDNVRVGANAFGKEGSSLYLKLGEEMSLQNLLYGLMLRSGNDAATAIAEHVGGSVDGFAYLMNEKAKLIGMTHSTFRNPHGLDDAKDHLSSANDMAKLTAYALKNPVFQDVVQTKTKKVPNPNEAWDYTWNNKNRMLTLYEGADGVKTGYTKLAKRCLVSSATRNGQQLAVVTLNDGDDWLDHQRLLDYGFKYFPSDMLAEKGANAGEAGIVHGASVLYPLTSEEKELVSFKITHTDPSSTDYRLGDRGRKIFYVDGNQIGSIPLYAVGSPLLKVATPEKSTMSMAKITGLEKLDRFIAIWRLQLKTLFTLGDR